MHRKKHAFAPKKLVTKESTSFSGKLAKDATSPQHYKWKINFEIPKLLQNFVPCFLTSDRTNVNGSTSRNTITYSNRGRVGTPVRRAAIHERKHKKEQDKIATANWKQRRKLNDRYVYETFHECIAIDAKLDAFPRGYRHCGKQRLKTGFSRRISNRARCLLSRADYLKLHTHPSKSPLRHTRQRSRVRKNFFEQSVSTRTPCQIPKVKKKKKRDCGDGGGVVGKGRKILGFYFLRTRFLSWELFVHTGDYCLGEEGR